jgi:phage-related minor tail protein
MAGIEAGFLNVLIGPKLVGDFANKLGFEVNKAAGTAGEEAGKTLGQKLSEGFNKTGKTLTKTVTAPILAVGGAAVAVGLEIDNAFDNIRVSTGATGESLKGLQDSFRNVASDSAQSFEDVGSTIATLNTRLGLTGKPLENLATQLLNIKQITGETADIEGVTQFFNAFGIEGAKQTETLDKLFIVSQKTGIGFNELISTVQGSVAQFQQLGFSAIEAAAFVGQLEKNGANSGAVLAALNKTIVASVSGNKDAEKAYSDLGKAQETLRQKNLDLQVAELKLDEIRANPKAKPSDVLAAQNAVQKLKDEILSATNQIDSSNKIITQSTGGVANSAKDLFQSVVGEITNLINAGDEAAANALAKDIFGARGFAQVVKQIKDGTFNLEEFTNTVLTTDETINGLANETADFDVQLAKLKQSGKLALEPIANVLVPAINSAFEAAKPTIDNITTAFRNLSPETQKTIVIVAGIAALIGPALLIFAKVITSIQSIIAVLKLLNLTLLFNPWTLIAIAAIAAVVLIIKNWDSIAAFFKGLWEGIVEGAKLLFAGLTEGFKMAVEGLIQIGQGLQAGLQQIIDLIVGIFEKGWEIITTAFKSAIDFIKQNWDKLLTIFGGPLGAAVALIIKNWDKIKTGFKAAVDFIINISKTVGNAITAGFAAAGNFINGIWNSIKNGAQAAISFIIKGFSTLRTIVENIIKFITNLPGLKTVTNLIGSVGSFFAKAIPGRADGGAIKAGNPYIVGELGPELIIPRTAGNVIPNNELTGIIGTGAGAIYNVTVNNPVAETSSASIPAALRRANILRSTT